MPGLRSDSVPQLNFPMAILESRLKDVRRILVNRELSILQQIAWERFSEGGKTLLATVAFMPAVRTLLKRYYELGIRAVEKTAQSTFQATLDGIMLKHRNWEYGVSDIDLILVLKDLPVSALSRRIKHFSHSYSRLRLVFPVLCPLEEIRFLRRADLADRTHCDSTASNVSESVATWTAVSGDLPTYQSMHSSRPLPDSEYIAFMMYETLEPLVFYSQPFTAATEKRAARVAGKLEEYMIQTAALSGVGEAVDLFNTRVIPGRGPLARATGRMYSVLCGLESWYRLLHARSPESGASGVVTPDSRLPNTMTWILADFQRYIDQGGKWLLHRNVYDDRFRLNLIVDSIDQATVLVNFVRSRISVRFRRVVEVQATTMEVLLGSHRFLSTRYPLESYVIQTMPVYGNVPGFRLAHPDHEWTRLKIRQTVRAYREFFLPRLARERMDGDPFGLYEVRVLLAFLAYLENPDTFFAALNHAGSVLNLGSWSLSEGALARDLALPRASGKVAFAAWVERILDSVDRAAETTSASVNRRAN